ncbi:MAG: NusG domain II-containing protein [Clostridiales bacterium]|nr:NusG domain II-containing protein [Clostridiales bacterium]
MGNKKEFAAANYRDLLLVLVILAIAAAGFLVNFILHSKPAAHIELSVDGQVIQTYGLGDDIDMVVDGFEGGTNHLIIHDNTAWIEDASCPDKLCVHQGKISHNGEMIVCLPNRVTVRVVSDNIDSRVDR